MATNTLLPYFEAIILYRPPHKLHDNRADDRGTLSLYHRPRYYILRHRDFFSKNSSPRAVKTLAMTKARFCRRDIASPFDARRSKEYIRHRFASARSRRLHILGERPVAR